MYLVLVLEISGKHQKRKERKKKKKINERKENIIKIVREVIFYIHNTTYIYGFLFYILRNPRLNFIFYFFRFYDFTPS